MHVCWYRLMMIARHEFNATDGDKSSPSFHFVQRNKIITIIDFMEPTCGPRKTNGADFYFIFL